MPHGAKADLTEPAVIVVVAFVVRCSSCMCCCVYVYVDVHYYG